ncbi:N-6 DNA methylase [Flavobacteriaceae bacterium Ap0902]|nr:N-6 DNA methylase [Flavobacteriaceae bacterium Ap0902]
MFQQTVVQKYLKMLDAEKVAEAWAQYQAHFLNPAIQENIRNSKEEQYQGEFLIDLFVKVLGYTKNPTPGFNLTTELKNVQDSKKADGAILIDDVVKAVIELKGTKTTDLTKVQQQAFNYKTSHPGCDVVIISNFEKLRLFIRNQTEYQEFNLFTLNKVQFDLLYLLLAHEYFAKNLLIKIKDESLSEEEEITKKLYKDYSAFKRELFHDLTQRNPDYDALTLFKSSQKLLDRFLFLFFAEDRGLLPPNAVREILLQWQKLQELDAYDTLINRFRKYFGYLNTGFKGKKYDIFAYNGGLFAPDEILDAVEISDDILYQYTQKLADYDYQSEVDVNILGHIFENSLNEIDEIKAELAGETIDKSKTKRKKDGVFYTPKYITQYIVENTVGKLCEEQKAKLNIKDEDYDPGANYQKKTRAKLEDQLVAYYDWLTQLTICDPACGSGAFLNQALDFLIKEHDYLTQLRQNLYAKDGQIAMAFPFSENDILENNLYGVDINEESVEIAKLSLWLRTAKPNRKLNSLNQNIKVGNSLIDDPEVAGEKAFVWEKEFAHVFEKGGFDVVIGNPPYVTNKLGKKTVSISKETTDYYEKKFEKLVEYKGNLFSLFIGKTHVLLKKNGKFSFIIPNSILFNSTFKNIRNFIREEFFIEEFINLNYEPFQDANTGGCLIFTLQKNKENNHQTRVIEVESPKDFDEKLIVPRIINYYNNIKVTQGKFLTNVDSVSIVKKCYEKAVPLGEIVKFYQGIITGNNKKYLANEKIDERYKKIIRGADVLKYGYKYNENYVLFDKELLWSNTNEEIFETKPKLINRQTSSNLIVAYDESQIYTLDSTHCQVLINEDYDLKTLLCIENSKLLNFIYNFLVDEGGRVFAQVKTVNLKKLPINFPSDDIQYKFISKANERILITNDLIEVTDKFIRTLERRFEIDKLSKKLESWHDLSFAEFVKELKKKKVKLSLAEEAEWEDYFTVEKAKAETLKSQITKTDHEIDQMVYDLYGLTEEEVAIVENS